MDYLEIEVYYKASLVEFTYYLSLMGTNPPTIRDRNAIDEITIWTLKNGKWCDNREPLADGTARSANAEWANVLFESYRKLKAMNKELESIILG